MEIGFIMTAHASSPETGLCNLPRSSCPHAIPRRTIRSIGSQMLPRLVAEGDPLRLWALSDLHVSHPENREALARLPARPDDWLILAGDVSHGAQRLEQCFAQLTPKFRQVVWVPGNHELWTIPDAAPGLRGVALYEHLVAVARTHGVLTPEDPHPVVELPDGPVLIAPLFLLYDYSFGTGGSTRARWCTGTSISGTPIGSMAYPSRRFRWGIRASGTAGGGSAPTCGKSPWRRRDRLSGASEYVPAGTSVEASELPAAARRLTRTAPGDRWFCPAPAGVIRGFPLRADTRPRPFGARRRGRPPRRPSSKSRSA